MKTPDKRLSLFSTALSMSVHNIQTLLCFEMLYRGIGFLLFFPLLGGAFRRLPSLAGQPFLTQGSFGQLLLHPAALCMLVGCLMAAGLFVCFELSALILYSEKGWRREPLTLWGLLRESARRTLSLLHPSRIAVFLFLPVMALSVFSFTSGYLRRLRVPEFILEYLRASPVLFGAWIFAVALFHLLFFLYLFGLPSLILQKSSFRASFKESRSLLTGQKLRAVGALFSALFGAGCALLGAASGFLLLLVGWVKLRWGSQAGEGHFRLYYRSLAGIWQLAAGALLSVFLCAVAVALYHRFRKEERPDAIKKKRPVKERLFRAGAMAGVVCLLAFLGESELSGYFQPPQEPGLQIVAHRAGAAFAPENTVAALHQAARDGAEMAEIDVQQLADGTLIVLHDTDFARVAGADLSVWDADYQQVKALDVGSSHSPSFAGEPVPTLKQMLKAAKSGGVSLMIELKSTGREKELVEKTVAEIREAGMEENCMIASMDYKLLEQSKRLAPHIPTVYISVLLLSQGYDLENVDGYSIETSSLTTELVWRAHMQGKKVYGWTANSEKTIRQLLSIGLDGVVTDNPLLARYCIKTQGQDLLLEDLCGFFFSSRPENGGKRGYIAFGKNQKG